MSVTTMGRQSALILCILGLAALALVLGLIPNEAEGQIPTMDISIVPEDREQTAEIGPTTNQVMEFEGEVTVSKPTPYIIPVDVDLRLEMPGTFPLWDHTFDPEFLTYTASGTQNFTCLVTVPPALHATDFFTLIFNGSTNEIPFYNKVTGNALVRIDQYYAIGRRFSTEALRVKQGDSLEFNLTVINRGNGADTLTLGLTNEDELNIRKLFVYFDTQIHLDPGAEARVMLRLEADPEAMVATVQLNFTIASEGSQSDPGSDTVTNFVEFTLVVEESIATKLLENWYIIAAALAVLIVVSVLLVRRRRRRAAEDEGEDEGEDDEEDLEDEEDVDEED